MDLNSQKLIEEKVVSEAWNNPAFKASLIENPAVAIEALTGQRIQLPEGKEYMVVVDQSDSKAFYFNIPAEANLEDIELTEDQLEAVAGGRAVSLIEVPSLPPCFPGKGGDGGCTFPGGTTGPTFPDPPTSTF